MKRKHVIGIIVIVLLVAAVFTGRYIYKESTLKTAMIFAPFVLFCYAVKGRF